MPQDVPEVAVKTRRGFSIVWLVPLVAMAIAGWLAYTTITEKGPEIIITFKTADGLEAGKTKVKFKDVVIGTVGDVDISEDLSHVVVTAEMNKGATPHLTNATRFWVVRPRLGAGGISGLGTLVSGAYIQMDPEEGEPATKFVGLEVPPVLTSDVPGREYLLRAAELGSISPGSPIYFRGIDVGEVLSYELDLHDKGVLIKAFVKAPHDRLVRRGSRFWNASGVEASLGADGVTVRTESLQALLTGGVAFNTPFEAMNQEPSPEGTEFRLYKSLTDIAEAQITEKIPYLMHFDGSVRGLQAGSPVEFRGIRVGTVDDIWMEFDPETDSIRIPVTIGLEPQRIKQVRNRDQGDPYQAMEGFVERGLRAQLKSGNLLTGALFVSLDFYPDAPAAKLRMGGKYPEIPTVPTELEAISRSVNDVLKTVAALPLEGLVKDMRKMVQSTEKLINSPDVRQSVESLRETADAAQATLKQAESTLASANSLIGPKSQLRYDAVQMMKELRGAARSIRVLTDYLERHPEALIQGKGGGAGR